MFKSTSIVVLASLFLFGQEVRGPVVTLTGVTVIDGTGRTPITNGRIVIADGKIRDVGPAAMVSAVGTVLDLKGRYVIPGLFNLHGHVGVTRGLQASKDFYSSDSIVQELERYLYFGVTSVRSCGVDSDLALSVRERSRQESFGGAHLFTALRGIAFKGGVPTTSSSLGDIPAQVVTPEEARQRVREVAAKKADFVKIWVDDAGGTLPKMPEAVYRAILEEASARHLTVSAHSYYERDVARMVEYGLRGSIHGIADVDSIDPKIATLLASKPFTYVPTLAAWQRYVFADPDGAPFLKDPALTDVFSPATVREASSNEYKTEIRKGLNREKAEQTFQRVRHNLLSLYRAGVRIGLGTDHTPTRFPGYIEHRELELMVDAGLTPTDAIVAGTRNSAEQLGVLNSLGTIEKGKQADFIVVSENPLKDIRNTRKIERVFKDGRSVDRAALRQAFR